MQIDIRNRILSTVANCFSSASEAKHSKTWTAAECLSASSSRYVGQHNGHALARQLHASGYDDVTHSKPRS